MSSKGLGLKQGMLTTVYQESERQRQRKLRAARREREKIVAEEERSGTRERKSEVRSRGPENVSLDGAGRMSSIRGVIPTPALTDKVHLHVSEIDDVYLSTLHKLCAPCMKYIQPRE